MIVWAHRPAGCQLPDSRGVISATHTHVRHSKRADRPGHSDRMRSGCPRSLSGGVAVIAANIGRAIASTTLGRLAHSGSAPLPCSARAARGEACQSRIRRSGRPGARGKLNRRAARAHPEPGRPWTQLPTFSSPNVNRHLGLKSPASGGTRQDQGPETQNI